MMSTKIIYDNYKTNYHASIVYESVYCTHLEGNTDEQKEC